MLKITLWWTSTLSRAAGSRKISSRFMHRISNGQMGHLPRKQSSPYYLPPRRQKDAPLKARVLCPNSHLGNVTAVPWQHLVKPTLALFSCQHQPILSHLKNTKKDTKIHSVYLINSSINPEESLWMRLLSTSIKTSVYVPKAVEKRRDWWPGKTNKMDSCFVCCTHYTLYYFQPNYLDQASDGNCWFVH